MVASGAFLFLFFAFLCISFKGISFPFKNHTAKRLNKSARYFIMS